MQSKLMVIMKEKDITNKELASKIGISEKQLGFKLKGKTRFKDTEMFLIASIFNLSVEEIFLPPMYENGTK